MSLANEFCYTLVAREAYLERLAVFELKDDPDNGSWSSLHEEVQRVLAALDDAVRLIAPDVRVTPGKTQGRNFYLFTYRTYARASVANIDPVVVGLTFTRGQNENEEEITIGADISGEEKGDRIVTLTPRTVPRVPAELVRAAVDLAQQLSRNVQHVVEALLDPAREM